MPSIERERAVEVLKEEMKKVPSDELKELYNEIFPKPGATYEEVTANPDSFRECRYAHVEQGLEIEEVVALWHLMYPYHWNLAYDHDTDSMCYTNHPDPLEWSG